MIDPASLQNWMDTSASPPPLPFGPTQSETNEVDKALDTLAATIRRAEGGERKSMASYLMRLPTASRTAKILAQLPSSQLMAFLERHRGEPEVRRRAHARASLRPEQTTEWREPTSFAAS